MARLGDVGKIITGNTPSTSDVQNYASKDICFVKPSDIANNEVTILDETEFYIAEYAREKARIIPPYCVLVTCIGIIGKVAINTTECAFNQQINAIIPNTKKCLPDYLAYALNNMQEELQSNANAPVVPIMNKSQFSEIDIFIPPLHEQEDIVDKLTKLSTLISLRKQQIAKLDELVKSRFVELFGDGRDGKTQLKMLGSICKFQQGTQIPVEEQFEEQISGYKRFLRIIDYTQAPQPPRYVNVNGKEVDEKSVVIVRYGATAGFVGRGYRGILANNLFEIMPDETILSKDFLFLALKYGTFEKDVHEKAFGAAMPALSFSMMKDIPVVVPRMKQQQQFAAFVEQINKSKLTIQHSLAKLETLKKSIMQKCFG